MIVEKVIEAKQAKMQQWPVRSNRASEMGHPCIRYLVLNRTRWNEKALPGPELQLTFDLGNVLEPVVIRDIQDAGFVVNQTQRAFEWKQYDITGSIDGKLIVDNKAYPLEIKTCSPFVFNAVNSVGDMHKSKYLYMRKYPTQLNLYLLMDEKERGLFMFKNKVNGQMKEIWMDLDYELGEQTLKKAEEINAHIAAGTMPEPMEWDDDICLECSFLHICTPDRIGSEIQIINDAELLDLLSKRESLAPAAKAYEETDKEIKTIVKGRDKLLVGPYLVTGKEQTRKGYMVKESTFWTVNIAKVA